jgi:hypothetical protein
LSGLFVRGPHIFKATGAFKLNHIWIWQRNLRTSEKRQRVVILLLSIVIQTAGGLNASRIGFEVVFVFGSFSFCADSITVQLGREPGWLILDHSSGKLIDSHRMGGR